MWLVHGAVGFAFSDCFVPTFLLNAHIDLGAALRPPAYLNGRDPNYVHTIWIDAGIGETETEREGGRGCGGGWGRKKGE